MKDNEIIKALECCICDECEDCPHDEETACVENLHQEALDLINRQKAEIERLQTENRILSQKRMNLFERLEFIEKAKAEAVKECIEKIKSKAGKSVMTDNGIPVAGSATYWISEVDLYEIEKEMVGAESG